MASQSSYPIITMIIWPITEPILVTIWQVFENSWANSSAWSVTNPYHRLPLGLFLQQKPKIKKTSTLSECQSEKLSQFSFHLSFSLFFFLSSFLSFFFKVLRVKTDFGLLCLQFDLLISSCITYPSKVYIWRKDSQASVTLPNIPLQHLQVHLSAAVCRFYASSSRKRATALVGTVWKSRNSYRSLFLNCRYWQ